MAGETVGLLDIIATTTSTMCSPTGGTSSSGGAPSNNLSLSGETSIDVSTTNKAILTATNNDFNRTKCFVYTYGDIPVGKNPRKFKTTASNNAKNFSLILSEDQVQAIIDSAMSVNVNVFVGCEDGQYASDTVTFSPGM